MALLLALTSVAVAEASSGPVATFTAAAPAFPPPVVVVDVEPAPLPLPPPGPRIGSPVFLPPAFTGQSCLRCSLLPQIQQREDLSGMPSQECSHLQFFPARHPASEAQYLQGLSTVAPCLERQSGGVEVKGVFWSV